MSSKRPAIQFYTADWRKDAEVQSCGLAARGLWHEMLCIMHECKPYGELRVNGKPMSDGELARLVGAPFNEVRRLLKELETGGVFSRCDDRAIYCRRMVRDEQTRAARAAGGQAGAEHGYKGAEHGKKGGRPRAEKPPDENVERGNGKPPLDENSKPAPSSSSSSSPSGNPPMGSPPQAEGSTPRSRNRRLTNDEMAERLLAGRTD